METYPGSVLSVTMRMGVNGKYRNDLIRGGKLCCLIKGEYLDGMKTGQWMEHDYYVDI